MTYDGIVVNLLSKKCIMERITIELKSKKKLETVTKILEALNISYVEKKNPSPSGDRWFLDQDNLAELDKGLKSLKRGKITKIKDPSNIWSSIL